jgi:hypothetical protein
MKQANLRTSALCILSVLAVELSLSPFALAGADACKADCNAYKNAFVPGKKGEMNLQYVIQNCGPVPGSDRKAPGAGTGSIHVHQQGQSGATTGDGASTKQQGVDPAMLTGDTAWDGCFATLQASWGQYESQCDAIDVADAGKDAEWVALSAFGVAAIVCGAACGTVISSGACVASGALAELSDVIGQEALNDEFNWSEADTAGAIGTGAAVAPLFLKNKVAKLGPCLAAGAMAYASASRYGKIDGMNHTADEACKALKKFISNKTPVDPKVDKIVNEEIVGKSTDHKIAADSMAAGKGGGGGGKLLMLPESVQKSLNEFPNSPLFAQATAGDTAVPAFKAIGGKEFMADALKQAAGLSMEDLAKRLGSGQSVSQIAASTSGMEKVAASLARFEDSAKKNGSRSSGSMLASSGTYKSSGGGAKPAARANPFSMFGGMKGPASLAGGAPSETTFEKAKRELSGLDGNTDIWHEGFNGTIFQIVSKTLGRTRERIDQLEWESPLNRALTGLPAKKPARSTAGVK